MEGGENAREEGGKPHVAVKGQRDQKCESERRKKAEKTSPTSSSSRLAVYARIERIRRRAGTWIEGGTRKHRERKKQIGDRREKGLADRDKREGAPDLISQTT